MKYAGMPMGMWVLFAGSFQKQLTAVLGYDAATARADRLRFDPCSGCFANFYSLLDNCVYDKTKGSSARTFVRDGTPLF